MHNLALRHPNANRGSVYRYPKHHPEPGRRLAGATSAIATKSPPIIVNAQGSSRSHEADVVVIGSGIGGLSCGALLARYGYKVTVCESHSVAGGAAHTWKRDGYHFESGPSLYSGMGGKGKEANPLAHVLQAIDEPLDLKLYNTWNVLVPEGQFLTQIGNDNFADTLSQIRDQTAVDEWTRFQEVMRPLASAAAMLPPAAFRFDPGVAITAFARYLPSIAQAGLEPLKLMQPFSVYLDQHIRDPFTTNWMNLLCFLLSGLPANGTISAEVAYMFNEWYRPGCMLEFPKGGSQALVDALARGVTKKGGRLLLNSHVENIMFKNGRASGVQLRGGGTITARKAVVSNASVWDTMNLLKDHPVPPQWKRDSLNTPACPSFMHLHIGFDATGLDDLELHHILVNRWEGGVDQEQNVVLISIASIMDPDLAPPGKHCLHAYLPATEPYELWKGLDRRSPEYAALKEERSKVLWDAVERIIPDIRQRAEFSCVGTPLTQQRYLRRHKGSYGPAIKAGQATFPGPSTPLPGLYCCGDSTFPGIGLPAVAASGMICANTLVPVWDHWKLLDAIEV